MERFVRLVGVVAALGLASLALAAVPERRLNVGHAIEPLVGGISTSVERATKPRFARARRIRPTDDVAELQAQLDVTMQLAHDLLAELDTVQQGLNYATHAIQVLKADLRRSSAALGHAGQPGDWGAEAIGVYGGDPVSRASIRRARIVLRFSPDATIVVHQSALVRRPPTQAAYWQPE